MKSVCLITGSSGLVGGESVEFFSKKFAKVIGIDNDMRAQFFGKDASIAWNTKRLVDSVSNFEPHSIDIRNSSELEKVFKSHGSGIKLIVHAAAQPSHDWAAHEPVIDFTVNANGTLNMLELARKYCPEATFIFTSTNKVYGDTANSFPLVELGSRWEIAPAHPYFKNGIDENMSIDQTKHSLFGASKVAADVLVQEYGKYFGMNAGVFRCGCLTGPNQSGSQLHGFLSYLMKCAVTGEKYTVFGYKGKQVRDNMHSRDMVGMFWHFHQNPKQSEVYNAGGGRHSNCSMAEAIEMCEEITGRKMNTEYSETARTGDHTWWISDVSKFKNHYPAWKYEYNLNDIVDQIYKALTKRK